MIKAYRMNESWVGLKLSVHCVCSPMCIHHTHLFYFYAHFFSLLEFSIDAQMENEIYTNILQYKREASHFPSALNLQCKILFTKLLVKQEQQQQKRVYRQHYRT